MLLYLLKADAGELSEVRGRRYFKDDEEKTRAFVALQMCVDVCVTTVLGRSDTAEQVAEPKEYLEAAKHPTREAEREAEALEAILYVIEKKDRAERVVHERFPSWQIAAVKDFS